MPHIKDDRRSAIIFSVQFLGSMPFEPRARNRRVNGQRRSWKPGFVGFALGQALGSSWSGSGFLEVLDSSGP